MIAALPMYLRPENRDAYAALWHLIRDGLRARGIAAPDDLDTDTDYQEGWGRADLVLSHICNLPWRAIFRDRVTLIGASDYGLPDCDPGYYRSLFVVRNDHSAQRPEDLAGAVMAYNSAGSHSGWGAPAAWAADRGVLFRPELETGSHREALRAIVERRVDFAAIDAQTFRDLSLYLPETGQVRVIGATAQSPGQSFITRAGQDPQPYFDAISEAISGLDAGLRKRIGLRGIVRLPQSAYDLPLPPTPQQMLSAVRDDKG